MAGVFLVEMVMFPAPVIAGQNAARDQGSVKEILISENSIYMDAINDGFNEPDLISKNLMGANYGKSADFRVPQNNNSEVKKVKYKTVTAYTSEEAQCDASPCITASGYNLCEHGTEDTIADNSLPFGTKVRVPELFGNKIFVVRDRMNSRYQNRIDIWMKDKNTALEFGKKFAKIEILE